MYVRKRTYFICHLGCFCAAKVKKVAWPRAAAGTNTQQCAHVAAAQWLQCARGGDRGGNPPYTKLEILMRKQLNFHCSRALILWLCIVIVRHIFALFTIKHACSPLKWPFCARKMYTAAQGTYRPDVRRMFPLLIMIVMNITNRFSIFITIGTTTREFE